MARQRHLNQDQAAVNWQKFYVDPSQAQPLRDEGLVRNVVKKVADFLKRNPGASLPREIGRSTESGAADTLYTSFADRLWQVLYDRRSVYFDLLDMDRNDPIVHTALNIIAECVTGYEDVTIDAFEWQMENLDVKAMQILKDLKSRLRLGSESYQIVRKFVLFGDEFREVVVDENMVIQRFKSLASYQIIPNFDLYGNKQPGWIQRPERHIPQQTVSFEEWQIVPFIYGARYSYFGTGLMTPARRTWRRLQKMEDGMAIARMTRAYDTRIHRIPVKSEWDQRRQLEAILEYRRQMLKRRALEDSGNPYLRDNPWNPETDIFIPDDGTKRGGVDILAAQNMQLMNIADLEYHMNALLCCLRVPRKYLNMGVSKGALTDASLTAEDVQFARSLRQAQAVWREGIMQLAKWALLFQGYHTELLGVGMKLPKISTHDQLQDAKIKFTMAQAAQLFSQTLVQDGLPVEIIADNYMQLTDEDKEVLKKFITEKQADQERMARSMAAAGGSQPGVKTGLPPAEKVTDRSAPDDDEDDGEEQSALEVAQALARLQTLCRKQMRHLGLNNGLPEGLGYPERLERNLQTIHEIAANGH